MLSVSFKFFGLIGLTVLSSCGKDSDDKNGRSANIPHAKPPVQEAAPNGLQSLNTPQENLASRFFSPDGGPSNIFQLLTNVDNSIDQINQITAAEEKLCQNQEPVAYTISPAGETITMYGQCVQTLAAGAVSSIAGFNQFGIKDGVYYIYSYNGGQQSAIIITPIAEKPSKYTVKAWFMVGSNTTSAISGSYGLMNLSANSDAKTFEFTVAGVGLGYCGAQLQSDGADIYAETSVDMGTTCEAKQVVCAKAVDITDSTTCSDSVKTFHLTPIGRVAGTGVNTFGASQYPLAPNLIFDGSASDAIHFGPMVATPGLGSLDVSTDKP